MYRINSAIMPRKVFTGKQLIEIKTLLKIGWSFWAVKRKLKQEGYTISDAYLSKLKNAKDDENPSTNKRER